jgi:hypothetical protein
VRRSTSSGSCCGWEMCKAEKLETVRKNPLGTWGFGRIGGGRWKLSSDESGELGCIFVVS